MQVALITQDLDTFLRQLKKTVLKKSQRSRTQNVFVKNNPPESFWSDNVGLIGSVYFRRRCCNYCKKKRERLQGNLWPWNFEHMYKVAPSKFLISHF